MIDQAVTNFYTITNNRAFISHKRSQILILTVSMIWVVFTISMEPMFGIKYVLFTMFTSHYAKTNCNSKPGYDTYTRLLVGEHQQMQN